MASHEYALASLQLGAKAILKGNSVSGLTRLSNVNLECAYFMIGLDLGVA